MKAYRVDVRVMPRTGILDPQGKAVAGALAALGFQGVDEVHVGRVISLSVPADSERAARESADAMCRQLLANPVTEDYAIEVHESTESAR